MRQKQINLFDLISTLELPNTCIDWIKLDYYGAVAGLRKFKKTIEKQRRRLAIKYHPDKEGGNLERMKTINGAIDTLLALRIQPPQKAVMIFRPFGGFGAIYRTFGGDTDSTTTGTGSW